MSTTYTTNYHLGKQENPSDNFNMSVITDNMDIIDTQMKNNENNISKYVVEETGYIKLKNLTWTRSGSGLYYSSTIDLTTVKTILSHQPMSFNGLAAETPPVIFQNSDNATNRRYALVATTGTFGDSAEISYRIYGTTD